MVISKFQKSTAWWDWAPSSSEKRRKRKTEGTLRKNYIPSVLAVLTYCIFIWYFFPVKSLLSVWIFKFVEFLQITKVLKLSLLTDDRLYNYSSLGIVLYVSFAFLLDLFRFLNVNLFRNLRWEDEKLVLSKWGWLGGETVRWNPDQAGIQILHKGGLLRKYLGLEKIVFFTNLSDMGTSVVAESPFFSSLKNKSFLDSLFESG